MTTDTITELDARAEAARNGDLADFSVAIHDWETEPYQDAWSLALEEENRLLLICPPDTYKSSTVQCFVEKMIGLDPDIRILWLMNAGEQSTMRIMAVAETLEQNNAYRQAFHVEPNYDAKWTKTALFVKRKRKSPDPTLMGCGFNGPYQGLHFDIIIIDDPTNQDEVLSPITMERQRIKLRGVIMDRLVEGGRIVGIMTRWGEDDLVPTFKSMGFKIVTMPIMGEYPWGPTLSNRRFPLARCFELRHDKTDAIFDLTYMCDPGAMDGGIIRRSYLRYWDEDSLPSSGVITLMACDPAASTATRADPSAIGVGVLELKPRKLYITDIWAGRVEIPELEHELIKRARGHAGLQAIGIETIGFQMTFMQRLKRDYRLPFIELPYRSRRQSTVSTKGLDKDKTGRAVSIAQMFTSGRLFLSRDLPYMDGTSVESELCAYPFAKHDDRLDVIAFLCAMADTFSVQRQPWRLRRA